MKLMLLTLALALLSYTSAQAAPHYTIHCSGTDRQNRPIDLRLEFYDHWGVMEAQWQRLDTRVHFAPFSFVDPAKGYEATFTTSTWFVVNIIMTRDALDRIRQGQLSEQVALRSQWVGEMGPAPAQFDIVTCAAS